MHCIQNKMPDRCTYLSQWNARADAIHEAHCETVIFGPYFKLLNAMQRKYSIWGDFSRFFLLCKGQFFNSKLEFRPNVEQQHNCQCLKYSSRPTDRKQCANDNKEKWINHNFSKYISVWCKRHFCYATAVHFSPENDNDFPVGKTHIPLFQLLMTFYDAKRENTLMQQNHGLNTVEQTGKALK